ncbi:hypothetical protein Lfu02_79810 [Longispora fulva]|uniref:Uncharacterized protein n=1 Tax=Longispora fulva TaxID=619741 RepID=A0A8J7GZA1_9ACTN|nr:hypothetical protein [Longispora fulva]MBG6141136.1 hypothetical protein [Longispora fulva]GIG63609.1 hypothetical protein Lfu02_79810 [Longispora fulva]
MALLVVSAVPAAGRAINFLPVSISDTVAAVDIADRGVVLHVRNGAAAPITVTVSDPGRTPAGNAPTVPTVSVPASGERQVLVTRANVDPATGLATVTYSSATTVTADAYRY